MGAIPWSTPIDVFVAILDESWDAMGLTSPEAPYHRPLSARIYPAAAFIRLDHALIEKHDEAFAREVMAAHVVGYQPLLAVTEEQPAPIPDLRALRGTQTSARSLGEGTYVLEQSWDLAPLRP